MIDYCIIPECYVDTNLVETIVPPMRGYNHQKGCGTVMRLMQGKLKDQFAVGIVDKDKKELKYVDEFEEVTATGEIQLLSHKDPEIHHYLIFIYPAVESWIIHNAKTAGIALKEFGLSDDLKELTKRTKKITSKRDKNLKNLFLEFKKRNVKSVNILTEWIKYLKDHPYNAEEKALIAITDKQR